MEDFPRIKWGILNLDSAFYIGEKLMTMKAQESRDGMDSMCEITASCIKEMTREVLVS